MTKILTVSLLSSEFNPLRSAESSRFWTKNVYLHKIWGTYPKKSNEKLEIASHQKGDLIHSDCPLLQLMYIRLLASILLNKASCTVCPETF
jgi:hypothetical protein